MPTQSAVTLKHHSYHGHERSLIIQPSPSLSPAEIFDFLSRRNKRNKGNFSPLEDVVEIIMRSHNFFYFLYFCGTFNK